MKKTFLALFMAFTIMATNAQEKSTVYQAFNSSWYLWENGEWVQQTENKDVDISIVFYKNAINIQAKTPTLYKIKRETRKAISETNIYGQSFESLECVNENEATVSYIYFREDKSLFLLSIMFKKDGNNLNFRYYCKLDNN
jgi:hypothetical protein